MGAKEVSSSRPKAELESALIEQVTLVNAFAETRSDDSVDDGDMRPGSGMGSA